MGKTATRGQHGAAVIREIAERQSDSAADLAVAQGLLREAGYAYSEFTSSGASHTLIAEAWRVFRQAEQLVSVAKELAK